MWESFNLGRTMKDFLNQNLSVGDDVIWIDDYYRKYIFAKVIKIYFKMIEIEITNPADKYHQGVYTYTKRTMPHLLIKLPSNHKLINKLNNRFYVGDTVEVMVNGKPKRAKVVGVFHGYCNVIFEGEYTTEYGYNFNEMKYVGMEKRDS